MRNKNSKESLLFFAFLVLSFIFWMLQSLNEDVEISLDMPITITHIPDKVILTSEPLTNTEIRIRDKGSAIVNYFIDGVPTLMIDFEQYKNKAGVINIKNDKFIALIRKQLKNSSTLLACNPDSMTVFYTQGKGKRVPVVVDENISIAPQCVLNGDIMQSQDSIMVYAPQHILKKIKHVTTEQLSTKLLSDTYVTEVKINSITGAKFTPNKIKITIPIEEITTKKLVLECVTHNLPPGLSMITFPAKIDISCNMAVSDFSRTNPKGFVVGVDYNQIAKIKGNKLPVQIFQRPQWIVNMGTSPDSVEYIIEEKVTL